MHITKLDRYSVTLTPREIVTLVRIKLNLAHDSTIEHSVHISEDRTRVYIAWTREVSQREEPV